MAGLDLRLWRGEDGGRLAKEVWVGGLASDVQACDNAYTEGSWRSFGKALPGNQVERVTVDVAKPRERPASERRLAVWWM